MEGYAGFGVVVASVAAAYLLFRRLTGDREEYITSGESVLVRLDGVEVEAECAKQPGGPFWVTTMVSPRNAGPDAWGSIRPRETLEVLRGGKKILFVKDVPHPSGTRSYEISLQDQDLTGIFVRLARVA